MSRLLSTVGEVSYNGFTFPQTLEASVTSVPRRDSAGVRSKFVVHTFTISCTIFPDDAPHSTAGGSVDENYENIRCRLLKSGGSFRFIGVGFGRDFVINDGGSYFITGEVFSRRSRKLDVAFGPHVTGLVWKPTGSNRAVNIIWTVEVTIPECCETEIGISEALWLMDASATLTWDLSDEGAMIRTVQGRYEIPGFLRNATVGGLTGFAAANASQLWDQRLKAFPLLNGFRREHRHTVSANGCVVEYTIVDKEIPSDNPYFPYMVKMDLTHRVSLGWPEILKSRNNISGTITIAPGTPRHWGWLAFSIVATQRVGKAKTITYSSKIAKDSSAETRKSFPFITELSIEEQIYGRSFNCSVSWWYLCAFVDLFKGNGMFTAIKRTGDGSGEPASWELWSNSMAEKTYSAYGHANMGVFGPEFHATICDHLAFKDNTEKAEKPKQDYKEAIETNPETPPPEQSWMGYSIGIEAAELTNTVRHAKIKNTPASEIAPGATGSPHDTKYILKGTGESASSGLNAHTTQVRGPTSNTVVVTGFAQRVGYKIPIPTVTSIGGVKPTIVSSKSKQVPVGRYFGVPVFAAVWRIELDLPSKPPQDLINSLETDGLPEQHV